MKTALKLSLFITLVLVLFACDAKQSNISSKNESSLTAEAFTPVLLKVKLNDKQMLLAEKGILGVMDPNVKKGNVSLIPVQFEGSDKDGVCRIVMLLPFENHIDGNLEFVKNDESANSITATLDPESGQVLVLEEGKRILQYNYQTVYEKDVVRLENEKLEQHLRTEKDTFVTASIYAVPRSDYIHPLYGLNGEMLTRDWPNGGHPHHRAIFWAWPEVEFGSEKGDIYALQRIFARPTGNIKLVNGSVYSQIEAENLWMWEDTIPIVRESAIIRVYRASSIERIIDLTIKLDALKDSISIATRNTDSYGGLNLRMMTPEDQEISYFTDEDSEDPQRAWSDFNGFFEGNEDKSGLMVLQHKQNPEYPGAWAEYPDLAWVQPTFPSPGTRYSLNTQESLVLRFRLIIHAGGKPDLDVSKMRWDVYHHEDAPLITFE